MLLLQQKSGIKTMQWIGGDALQISDAFKTAYANEFKGLSQIQFHLNLNNDLGIEWPYEISIDSLKEAIDITKRMGIEFEVLPFEFDKKALFTLLDLGVRWFAIDYPKKFLTWVKEYKVKNI